MIHILYRVVHFVIRYSGIAFLFRILFARKKVSIILYHNPKPEIFEKHINYLSRNYNLISLPAFAEALYRKESYRIPPYALIVTFDDGWKENHVLLPLFRKYAVRPTIFLTSHLIDTDRHFWWTCCDAKDIDRLKHLSNRERLSELASLYDYCPDREYNGERQALNLKEITEMKEYVDFGLHTSNHPVLTTCTYEEKKKEITLCREEVEQLTGLKAESFAYPNGDYDQECIGILKKANVKTGRTFDAGWNDIHSDPYRLKVTGVSDDASVTKLASELTGISMYFQFLLHGSFNGIKSKT